MEILNLDAYGLYLEKHEDDTYEVIDGIGEPWNQDHYAYDNRSEAISHIVTDILNVKRVYDEESLPDDLARAYTAVTIAGRSTMSRTMDVAYTFLFHVLDSIAAANEYAERRK